MGSRVKQGSIKRVVIKSDPDILSLLETKLEQVEARSIGRIWTHNCISWCSSLATGRSGGLIVAWKEGFLQVYQCTIKESWIALLGETCKEGYKIIILSVYAHVIEKRGPKFGRR